VQNAGLPNVKLAVHKVNLCVLRKWLSKRTTSFIAVSAGNFESPCKSMKPVFGRTTFHSLCCSPTILLINIPFVMDTGANNSQGAAF
jgi:hypothetical protein